MQRFILIFSILLLATFSSRSQQQKLYTSAQLKQDFGVFKTALIEAHPGLYRYQSKQTVEAQFASVNKELNRQMSEQQFYCLLNELVANIRCAHTKFHRDGKPDDHYAFHQEGLFPLKLYFAPYGKVYALSSYTDDRTISPGSEVKRINGQTVGAIKELLFRQIAADGRVMSSKYQELNQFFPGYYANFIGTADFFSIEYLEKGSDRITTQKLAAAVLTDIQPNQEAGDSASPFLLSFPESGVALMTINVFSASEEQFESFLSTSFAEISQRKTSHLILDLRNNEGGMDRFGARLYSWLTTSPFRYYDHLTVASMPPYRFAEYATLPQELDQLKVFIEKKGKEYYFTQHQNLGIQQSEVSPFTGKLYVLQNGRSLSVTSEFAAVVRDNKRGVFIGEESGGTISGNNSGGFALVTLPNTRLGLDIPLLGYYMYLQHPQELDRGILPDYPIGVSVTDILEQKDPVLEKALQLIHEAK